MKFNVTTGEGERGVAKTALVYDPSNSDIIVASDDKTILQYNSEGEITSQPTDAGSYITSLSCYPSPKMTSSGLLAAACSDGTLLLLKRNGTTEKRIKAHDGAAICVGWNADGSSLATSGEDGEIKIWSRTGNLRTKLAAYGQPVYAFAWNFNDDSLVVAFKNLLGILHTQGKGKKIQWEAHPSAKGVVLAVDWDRNSNQIICGGEDCCYRIFDNLGLPLFVSKPLQSVITSIAWSPSGKTFAVGSFDVLQLCDRRGWVHSQNQEIKTGSILDMTWSSDGSQLAGSCGNGSIILANIVGKKIQWDGVTVELVDQNKISVCELPSANTESDIEEHDEVFRDSVVEFHAAFNNLVVCTRKQCHVYKLPDLNSPVVIDLKHTANLIVMSAANFLVAGMTGITFSSYEGRRLPSFGFQGFSPGKLSEDNISISQDTLAVIDHTDSKVIRIFDAMTGRPTEKMAEIIHNTDICKIKLSCCGSSQQDRRLVFVDRSNDMFISPVAALPGIKKHNAVQKIATQISTFSWNCHCDVLVAMTDSRLVTWLYPNAPFVDNDLLGLASEIKDASEFGKYPQIVSFSSASVTVRCDDGTEMTENISPFPCMLHQLVLKGEWKDAVRLCRVAESSQLWAALSGLALEYHELETAEVAFSSLAEVDKLQHIKYIRGIPNEERRNAEIFLYRQCPDEAVSILLQANPPLIYRAIKVHISLFNWEKALSLAIKRNTFIDVVLWYRRKFLNNFHLTESNEQFKKFSEKYGELDQEQIKKIKEEAKAAEKL